MDTSSEVGSKIAAALLNGGPGRRPPRQGGRQRAGRPALHGGRVDTPLDVDTKIANALLGLATEAFVAAQLASRDASITALQASKADATLLASYATNAALSASETALQSALDAILAELAALQLSGSGVVNAPAGFTSNVVRNLHFMAPLSAALANGDDTLSITTATPRRALAGLLHLLTSGHSVGRLPNRNGAGRGDDQRHHGRAAGLLHLLTSGRPVGRLPHGRGAGHADAGGHCGRAAGLQDGPDQITSALVAYRSAADQDTATASSIAAALLSYYTIAQVDGLLAGKLGVTEAASALQIALSDDGGADEVVAAIGEQILGPTDVSLSNWTVRPSSGCSVVLATHTTRVSVDGYTLTLAANPWNIARTYNLTPGQELLFACRYRLGTASNFVVYMSEADNVYDPLYGSFVGDQGAWSTAKMYFTVPPNGVAKLHFGAHFQAPGLPNQTAGTVDVYGLQILDATLLLKHEFLDGGANDVTLATLGEVLLEPTLGNFLVRSNSQSSVASASFAVGGFQLEGYAMTLSAFAWNIVRTDAGETLLLRLPVPAGHGLQLGDVRQRGRQRLRGRHRHLPRHALAASGARRAWTSGRNREAALRSFRRVYPRAGAAVGGHAGPVQHADQGQRLQGRVCLSNGPAGRLAGPHGLGHAGRAHRAGQRGCDQLLCNDVNCTDVFTTGVDASDAVSCAALTATGTVAGATLTSTGAVSGSSLSISGAASVGLSSATGITGSTLTINNTANAGNFTTVGNVHGHADGLGRSNRGASQPPVRSPERPPRARWTARAWTAPSRPRAAECRRA